MQPFFKQAKNYLQAFIGKLFYLSLQKVWCSGRGADLQLEGSVVGNFVKVVFPNYFIFGLFFLALLKKKMHINICFHVCPRRESKQRHSDVSVIAQFHQVSYLHP